MLLGRQNISRVKRQARKGRTPSMNILRLASDVANAETFTINGTVFEIDTAADPGSVSGTNTRVNCSGGATPAAASTAIVTAVNSVNCGMRAKKISDNEVLFFAAAGDATPYACTETLAGTNNAFAAATAFGGRPEQTDLPSPILISRVPTATEITLQTMHFPLTFTPTIVLPQVRTSAGAIKAWDGAVTITDQFVTVGSGGSTDIASGDVITLAVW